jgi:hypothetical protein
MATNEVISTQPHSVAVVATNPARLLEIAVSKGTDMDQLEKLMALQERWEANEARKGFAAAMAAFRAEAPVIEKNAQVDFTSQKGRTNYRHSSLDHITAKVNPVLGRHGLTYSWVTEQNQGAVTVHCDVMHVMGHRERVTLTGPRDESGNKNAIQSIGSAVSYLQRYTLLAALGLSTGGQDDDGRASDGPTTYITQDQQDTIQALLDEVKADTNAFLRYMGAEGGLAYIRADAYATALHMLEKKRAK